jgi:putative glutamine amidotransferase
MLEAIATHLDGLLLSGGGDVDPRHFGEQAVPECGVPEPERDETELWLARWALERRLPVLGICRGLQVLNIVLGGSLYQDLPTQYERPLLHHNRAGEVRNFIAHDIAIDPQSRLAGILGVTSDGVNSFHHQGLKAIGEGLQVVATAEDGVAEGAEMPAYPFVVAVQYHPEAMEESVPSQRLFAAFVAACQPQ